MGKKKLTILLLAAVLSLFLVMAEAKKEAPAALPEKEWQRDKLDAAIRNSAVIADEMGKAGEETDGEIRIIIEYVDEKSAERGKGRMRALSPESSAKKFRRGEFRAAAVSREALAELESDAGVKRMWLDRWRSSLLD